MIASGPSTSADQIRRMIEARYRGLVSLFAVSDAYRLLGDNLDFMYSCDPPWWDLHAAHLKNRPFEQFTQSPEACKKYNWLQYTAGRGGQGLGTDPAGHIHFGGNSGYQAINVAYLMGFRLLILVGFDMRVQGKLTHFFGDHPGKLQRNSSYSSFIPQFREIKKGIDGGAYDGLRILNSSLDSALDAFPKVSLQSAIDDYTPKI